MASESARSPVTASASSSVARALSSGPRAKRARWDPRCARRRAQAAPMPLLEAVTIATCAEGMDGNLEAVQASNETKLGILGRSVRLLQLYAYHVEITCADILERMWRQSLRPKG